VSQSPIYGKQGRAPSTIQKWRPPVSSAFPIKRLGIQDRGATSQHCQAAHHAVQSREIQAADLRDQGAPHSQDQYRQVCDRLSGEIYAIIEDGELQIRASAS
jgi:hypothetical protein